LKKAAGKKKVKRLDRDRPEIKKARKDLTALLAQAFKEEARAAAAQIADLAGLAKTQTKDEDLLDKILRQLRSQGIDAIVEEVQQVLARAAQNGGLAALAQINIDDPVITRQVNQLAVEWAQKRAAEMVGKKWVGGELVDNPDARWAITDTTRDLLRGDVAQAMEEGWSSQQLADKLEANYAFSEARAEAVARTEIANADAEGNFIAYQESGVVEGSESILGSEHGDQQDECDDNADAGVVPLGEPYPSGHLHAPYHTNCICDNMPVLIGEGTA
jgi:hypothetical protein